MDAMAWGALAAFLAIKLAAYSSWCAFGQRRLGAPTRSLLRALALGATRLGLGLGLGWLLTAALTAWSPDAGRLGLPWPKLLVALVVLRFLEWSAIGLLIRQSRERALRGRDWPERWWRVGGVVLSFATDAAALFTIGALGWMPC